MDRLAHEKLSGQHGSGTSTRAPAGKLVTFDDKPQRTTSSTGTTVHSKPKGSMNVAPAAQRSYSESDDSDDDQYTARQKPAVITEIQPSPRKNAPATGVSALAAGSMRPTTVTTTTTVSTSVRPKSAIKRDQSER